MQKTEVPTRICSHCHQTKPVTEYWATPKWHCKQCVYELNKGKPYVDTEQHLKSLYEVRIEDDGIKVLYKLCDQCNEWKPIYSYHNGRRICRTCANIHKRADRQKKALQKINAEREERTKNARKKT